MVTQKIFISAKIPEAGIKMLREKEYAVDIYKNSDPITKAVLKDRLAETDALISLLSDTIDEEIIGAAPKLKIIANYAVGYNNIDLEAARKRGIIVSNTPDILTPATADLTWALILSVSKRIPEADRFMRAGRFKGWGPQLMLGGDVSGKTLGIIGMGRIGSAVAKLTRSLGMKNIGYDGYLQSKAIQERGAEPVTLNELLRESDFITLHAPLTPETENLIDAKAFAAMKTGVFIINAARGKIINENALLEALNTGKAAGATLDVFSAEPPGKTALITHPKVIATPHIGGQTKESLEQTGIDIAQEVFAALEGEPLRWRII